VFKYFLQILLSAFAVLFTSSPFLYYRTKNIFADYQYFIFVLFRQA